MVKDKWTSKTRLYDFSSSVHLWHPSASEVFPGSPSCTHVLLLLCFWPPFRIQILVLPCSQASLALRCMFHSLASTMQPPAPAPALELVRKLLNQDAATTASGPSITLVWRGSWAQFADYYHRDSSRAGYLTQPVRIQKGFLKEQVLERNYPKTKGRMRFFDIKEEHVRNQGEMRVWCP